MKKTRILTNSFLLMSLIIIISTKVVAQTFTLKNTVIIDFGAVWCVPVYDGTNIVVSSESGGVIKAGKFDLSLNEVASHATTVADTADTANNDSIADHKHIFQNGYHYLVFSTAGGGQGGYLYLLKLDADLNRVGITTVVNDEFYRIIFDNDWNIVKDKETILSDEGMLSIVSALSVEPNSQEFIIHYGRGSGDAGGPLYRAVYDSDWNPLSNTQVIDGTWTRPHSVDRKS